MSCDRSTFLFLHSTIFDVYRPHIVSTRAPQFRPRILAPFTYGPVLLWLYLKLWSVFCREFFGTISTIFNDRKLIIVSNNSYFKDLHSYQKRLSYRKVIIFDCLNTNYVANTPLCQILTSSDL